MPTKIGVIADCYDVDPTLVDIAIEYFKQPAVGINLLVLNGGLGRDEKSIDRVLGSALRSGIPFLAQPGCCEPVNAFEDIAKACNYNESCIRATSYPWLHRLPDHDIVLLPGSATRAEGTGHAGFFLVESTPGRSEDGSAIYIAASRLELYITRPDKTVIFCHEPCQTKAFSKGPDYVRPPKQEDEEKMVEALESSNKGSAELRGVYDFLCVSKAVSAHFPDGRYKGCDLQNRQVLEGQLTRELFWNAGMLNKGYCGIVTMEGEAVSFEEVPFR